MKRIVSIMMLACLAAVPASAHHSFGLVFDADQPVRLTGTVTKIDWRSPHTHVYVDVRSEGGKVVTWTLEGNPPNTLARAGWEKDVTVRVGDVISIVGSRARDGSPSAHLREATLADGKHLFFGPPAADRGAGAP